MVEDVVVTGEAVAGHKPGSNENEMLTRVYSLTHQITEIIFTLYCYHRGYHLYMKFMNISC